MAKIKKAFFCKNCGFEAPKWLGKCPSCGEWNTFTEEIIARETSPDAGAAAELRPATVPQRLDEAAGPCVRFEVDLTEAFRERLGNDRIESVIRYEYTAHPRD